MFFIHILSLIVFFFSLSCTAVYFIISSRCYQAQCEDGEHLLPAIFSLLMFDMVLFFGPYVSAHV